MTKYGFVCLLASVMLFLFQIQILTYVNQMLPEEPRRKKLLPLLGALNSLALVGAFWARAPIAFLYLLGLCLYVGEFMIFFRQKFLDGLLIGGVFIYTTLCLHGVMIPLIALVNGLNMYDLIHYPMLYTLSVFLTLTICNAAMPLFRRLVTVERLKLLLRCRTQTRLVSTSMCLLLAYLLLETYVYYYNFPLTWTSLFHMITSLVAQASFYVVLWYSVDISSYIEYELKTRQVEKQLQRQVVHYQQYTHYVSSLRAFKHDYKRMAETARHLVDIGAQKKALRLLSQMNEEMEHSLKHIQYSNHVVVDAILQECANQCKETGISFSAIVNLPDSLGLSDLELCRIFGNLIDNAYEACEQIAQGKCFINLESGISGDWVTVKISNSFANAIQLVDGLPVSRKHDQNDHGIGLASTKQIVESTGGFMQIEIDQQRHIFNVSLHLCMQ